MGLPCNTMQYLIRSKIWFHLCLLICFGVGAWTVVQAHVLLLCHHRSLSLPAAKNLQLQEDEPGNIIQLIISNDDSRNISLRSERKRNVVKIMQKRSICTIFTTFKDLSSSSGDKGGNSSRRRQRNRINVNTLRNWANMLPELQPVLFFTPQTSTTTKYDSLARKLGWHVLQIPRTNAFGTPFIADMINTITSDAYDSEFYGFANGDILFDDSLVKTLRAIIEHKATLPTAPVLVVGRRINYKINDNFHSTTEPLENPSYVRQLRDKESLFWSSAEDYFLFTRDFPRYLFDDLVIGRPAYDNYLVAMAMRLNVTVIDASATLTALHQQLQTGFSKSSHHRRDAKHNILIIGSFDYRLGYTDVANYETTINKTSLHISVNQRKRHISIT